MATRHASIPVIDDDPVEALLRQLRRRDDVSEQEADMLRAAIGRTETVGAGERVITAGVPLTQSMLLLDGFVARYKDLAGGQRQITELHVPGDLVDLHGFLLKRIEHHVGTLTVARVAWLPHAALSELTERAPHLGRVLWTMTLVDASIQRERLLTIGRRSALARVAHLLCELHARLDAIGAVTDGRFRLPLTQIDLADAIGLTSVHLNRMLRQLRAENILTLRTSQVEILNLPRLREIAEFDPGYLYLDSQPR